MFNLFKDLNPIEEEIMEVKAAIGKINNNLTLPNVSSEKLLVLQRNLINQFEDRIPSLRSICEYEKENSNGGYFSANSYYYHGTLKEIATKLKAYQTKIEKENFLNNKKEVNITNINTNTNNNIIDTGIIFDGARKSVDENESLEDECIEEIKAKITEIEKIFNSTDSKKDKWSKCSDILSWVSNKGVAIATIIVPLIAKCLENK